MINSKRLLIGGGVCWLGFLIFMLAYLHGRAWLKSYDTFGYQLTQPATPAKTAFLRGLTTLGEPAVLGGATVALMLYLWWRQRISDSMWYGAVNFIGGLLLFQAYGPPSPAVPPAGQHWRLQFPQRPHLWDDCLCPDGGGPALATPPAPLGALAISFTSRHNHSGNHG